MDNRFQQASYMRQIFARDLTESVTTDDVARLRQRVRNAVEQEHAPRWGWTRWMSAAAAVALVAGGLSVVRQAQQGPTEQFASNSAAPQVTLLEGGTVRIAFPDGEAPHQVIKSLDPMARNGSPLTAGKDQTFLDNNGKPRPGTVVFYRVD